MKKPILISIAVITAICLVSCKSTSLSGKDFPSAEDSIVEVQGGKIFGALSDDGVVISYKGIPYAAAPVGELRWEDPQDVEPWDGVRECTSLGHNCIQWSESESTGFAKEFGIDLTLGSSEDCLTANVWTLNGDQENKKPVVVFIHGGGYVLGGSSCPVYGGESLARKGVVFISINYRLGAFGFLSIEELSNEKSISGNYALKDAIKALQWVRDNADVFGGDASNVTVIGQSAGARLVQTLVVSPKAEGLFSKAVTVSGGLLGRGFNDPQTAYRNTKSLVGDLSVEELRAIDAQELATTVGRNAGSMVIDGTYLTDSPSEVHKSGTANNVVVINGFVSGDAGGVYSGKRYIRTQQAYEEAVTKHFGDFASKVLEVYPATDETAQVMINLVEQEENLGKVMYEASLLNNGTSNSSYTYYATHPYPQKSEQTALAHTEDLAYWFNNLAEIREPYLTDYDYKLADTMSDFIVSFATDGDPNGKGLPTWNANTGDGSYMLFGEDVSCEKMSQSKLDLWMEYYSNNN